MRMKRFLSLMLAVAMLASLTISASAASKLYYAQDFDYADMDALWKDIYSSRVSGDKTTYAREQIVNGYNMTWYAGTIPTGGLNNGSPTLTEDSSGVKWFTPYTDSTKNGNGRFYLVPNDTWDYTAEANQGQTYVISFDTKVVNPATKQETYPIISLWTDGTDVNNDKQDTFYHFRQRSSTELTTLDLGAYYSNIWNKVTTKELSDNTVYKLAVGYKYDADKTYPHKTMAVDGTFLAESTSTGAATSATPILGGLMFSYRYSTIASFANIKMYTIDNSGLTVSSTVTGTVPTTTTSVPVKFSQPVYAASFVPADVTVTAGDATLEYGKDFTVSAVEDVIGNVGEEIYSTATVTFTNALAENTTYTITFPDAIKNEIGTAIAGKTVTFNTPAPEIVVGNKIITKAWGTASEATANEFAAGDGVYGVSIDIENTTDANKAVAVIYAVYAGGKLEDVVYANEEIAATKTATIGAGVNLSADVTAVKAFIWDGITSLKPSAESTTWNITE